MQNYINEFRLIQLTKTVIRVKVTPINSTHFSYSSRLEQQDSQNPSKSLIKQLLQIWKVCVLKSMDLHKQVIDSY